MMRVEIHDHAGPAAEARHIDEILAGQLRKRLSTVLHGISSERYNIKEHKKRLELIQNKLDAQFDKKRKKTRI